MFNKRCQQTLKRQSKTEAYQSRKRPFSLMPILLGSYPRCRALSMMTGNALEYFRALARCCPPHPVDDTFCVLFLTRKYSIRHCLNRIMLGILMTKGTIYWPPQPLSGLLVDDTPVLKNMQTEIKKSPRTLA